MQDHYLFEYAVIRVMPRVEREEFLNVGVILYCAKQNFLRMMFVINEDKFKFFAPELDLQALAQNLYSIQRISAGDKSAGSIAILDMASRFRWLTATRSTVLQCSKVHPGFCKDANTMLMRLHTELAL
ncbi:DUF3037 domain-containing protein [Pedobacter changchengzhani]|uniref:DUF3037 domain-containing protein n=1 Tax=Pedobacter changchengzhani TaxID=2529274 RepID=A0A4R5MKD9_9SPHI|nr:DUF3037 domain-containing protein [Pedobacter changchengzhani]TDG36101.1 DUF3037 domain-containing protein [Pedobacter changchengzhani]